MKYDLSNHIDRKKAEARFNKLLEQGKPIELKELKKARTLAQNRYLHVSISIFAIEFGYNLDEAKTHLKRNCDFMRYEKDGEVFLKRTRDMNTLELTDFVEWIRTYAGQKGCYIMSADEYLTNQIEIDREIDRYKEYL